MMILPEGVKLFHYNKILNLEQGGQLPELQVAYHTFGELNEARDNVVWVFHALTANSNPTDWWKGVVGENSHLNAEDYFIVCVNIFGSYYGTTNPRSINPKTGEAYGIHFPVFTVRDVVQIHKLIFDHLNINKIALCIGGSFGGHQALEFVLMYPNLVKSLFLLATSSRETAWSIAIHEAQRMAIESDWTWSENTEKAGATGLKTARALGLISYRTIDAYINTQTDEEAKYTDFKAASYVRYQGEKLEQRFHAHCYWHLTKCLDTHHVGRNRGAIEKVLESINIPATVIGIDSDLLIPTSEQKKLASHIPNATYYEISSKYGHDGFLVEVEQINKILVKHLSFMV